MTEPNIRIRWETDPDTGAPKLPRAEAEAAFRARTGLDPYDEIDPRGNCMAAMLVFALDGEARARRTRRNGTAGEGRRGRPATGPALKRALATAVKELGGPGNAALFLWLHGLEQSTAHVLRPPRDGDEAADAKAAYEALTKRLDVVAKEAASLPKPQ